MPGASLYVGDCVSVLSNLNAHGFAGSVPLIFSDPPFNIGRDYGDEGVDDQLSAAAYQEFTRKWITQCVIALRPGGSMFVYVPDHVVAHVYVVLKARKMIPVNWLILHQRFGQYVESKFICSKNHLLYFAKPGVGRTWNVREVLEPSERLLTGDKRIHTAKFKGYRPMFDCWMGENMGRVQGNNAERRKRHDNQLPELLLARVIRCAQQSG